MTVPSIGTPFPVLLIGLLILGACTVEPHIDDDRTAEHSATIPSRFTMPEAYGNGDWRLERLAELNEVARRGNIDLLFLGDSITQGWNGAGKQVWDRYYARRCAANFGMDADRAQQVLWRIEQGHFEQIHPKAIVLLIGTNNASSGETAQEIAAGVVAVVHRLREKAPESKILLLAIFPAGERPDNPRRMRAAAANAAVRTIADGRMVRYLDIGDRFMNPDGTISKELMPDFLHLSPHGYELWAEAIEPAVQDLLGEPQDSRLQGPEHSCIRPDSDRIGPDTPTSISTAVPCLLKEKQIDGFSTKANGCDAGCCRAVLPAAAGMSVAS